MQRRTVWMGALAGAGAGLGAWVGAQTPPEASTDVLASIRQLQQTRQGGVLLVRHASTEPGLGDPPGFVLSQCQTQRNLSEAGRAQARALGAWFARHGLPV